MFGDDLFRTNVRRNFTIRTALSSNLFGTLGPLRRPWRKRLERLRPLSRKRVGPAAALAHEGGPLEPLRWSRPALLALPDLRVLERGRTAVALARAPGVAAALAICPHPRPLSRPCGRGGTGSGVGASVPFALGDPTLRESGTEWP